MPRQLLYGVLFLAILLAIAYLSLTEIELQTPDLSFNAWDKLAHATVYGMAMLLGGLYFREINSRKKLGNNTLLALGLALFGYGIGIEVLQHILPVNRWGEMWDAVANGFGIIIVGFYLRWYSRKTTVKKD